MNFKIGNADWVSLTVRQGSGYCVTRHQLAQPDLEQTLQHEALEALARIQENPEQRMIAFGREQVRFYDELIEEVKGYSVNESDQDLMKIESWQSQVPAEHKLEVMARRCVFLKAPAPGAPPTGADSGSASSDSPPDRSRPVPGSEAAPNLKSSRPAMDAGREKTPERATPSTCGSGTSRD